MPILCALFTLLQHLGDYFDGETFSFYGILPNLQTSVAATLPQGFGVAAPYVVALLLFAVLTLVPQLYMSRNQTGAQAQTVKTTAIMGVGAAKRKSAVKWQVAIDMVKTWVLTFPGCGLIGFLTAELFLLFV